MWFRFLQSDAKLLGHLSCSSAPRSPYAMLRGKFMLQKIALTIDINIAQREGSGRGGYIYLSLNSDTRYYYVLPHMPQCVLVHLMLLQTNLVLRKKGSVQKYFAQDCSLDHPLILRSQFVYFSVFILHALSRNS